MELKLIRAALGGRGIDLVGKQIGMKALGHKILGQECKILTVSQQNQLGEVTLDLGSDIGGGIGESGVEMKATEYYLSDTAPE